KYKVGICDIRATFNEFKAELKREARQLRADAEYQVKLKAFETQEKLPWDVLEEMNKRYAIVNYSGGAYIVEEKYNPIFKSSYLEFMKPYDFRIFLGNKFVTVPIEGSFKLISYADFWLKHEQRKEYKGIVLWPGNHIEGYLNLWQGYQVKPVKGCCRLYKQHVFDIACNRDTEKFNFLWRYIAHLFQKPCDLPESSIVMRGKQGAGKNLIMKPLEAILGNHFIAVTQNSQLAGRFNQHLMNALVVFANEAVWGGDKQGEGTLKAMITDAVTTIEAKGKDAIRYPNYKRIFAASNEHWAVPRGVDDRRFFCLDISDSRKEDKGYFNAIYKELDTGGIEALLYEWLYEVDLTDWHPRGNMPKNNADGEDMKLEGLSTPLKFIHHVLTVTSPRVEKNNPFEVSPYASPYTEDTKNPEQVPTIFNSWPETIDKTSLYEEYIGYCDKMKNWRMANIVHFAREIMPAIGAVNFRKTPKSKRVWKLPPLEQAKNIFLTQVANVPFDD
ncbi:MAG: hypothetical protein GY757_35275, partial [bacterium]|nr:hypothetical protein [bacterium]